MTDNDFTHNIRSSSVHYEKVHIIVPRNHELKMASIRMLEKNTCNGKKLMKTKRSPASADSSVILFSVLLCMWESLPQIRVIDSIESE